MLILKSISHPIKFGMIGHDFAHKMFKNDIGLTTVNKNAKTFDEVI